MKALKSKIAKEVLADPSARDQLRTFAAQSVAGSVPNQSGQLRTTTGKIVRVRVVPKAA